jgi:hypothetical protein
LMVLEYHWRHPSGEASGKLVDSGDDNDDSDGPRDNASTTVPLADGKCSAQPQDLELSTDQDGIKFSA